MPTYCGKRITGARHKTIRVQRDRALIAQGNRRFYCKSPLKRTDATADHRIPTSQGGVDRGNIVAACQTCNGLKGNMSAAEFRWMLGNEVPAPFAIMVQRSIRRINKRADKACKRIRGLVGLGEYAR